MTRPSSTCDLLVDPVRRPRCGCRSAATATRSACGRARRRPRPASTGRGRSPPTGLPARRTRGRRPRRPRRCAGSRGWRRRPAGPGRRSRPRPRPPTVLSTVNVSRLVEVVEGLDLAVLDRQQLGLCRRPPRRPSRAGQLDLLDALGREERDLLAIQRRHVSPSFGSWSPYGYRGARRANRRSVRATTSRRVRPRRARARRAPRRAADADPTPSASAAIDLDVELQAVGARAGAEGLVGVAVRRRQPDGARRHVERVAVPVHHRQAGGAVAARSEHRVGPALGRELRPGRGRSPARAPASPRRRARRRAAGSRGTRPAPAGRGPPPSRAAPARRRATGARRRRRRPSARPSPRCRRAP